MTEEIKHNIGDPGLVCELFEMAADEILYWVAKIVSNGMHANCAREMDEALAKRLARALMGENSDFAPAVGWSGIKCAESLREVFDRIWGKEPEADPANPRILMVRAAMTYIEALYVIIKSEINKEGTTRESVRQVLLKTAGVWALAAVPATE